MTPRDLMLKLLDKTREAILTKDAPDWDAELSRHREDVICERAIEGKHSPEKLVPVAELTAAIGLIFQSLVREACDLGPTCCVFLALRTLKQVSGPAYEELVNEAAEDVCMKMGLGEMTRKSQEIIDAP